jgi:hypothetical protein
VKFVIQQDLFELHPSIFEDSMAISLFWHILAILQTGEKSLKWPQNLQEWSDFTFKKRRIKYSSSLIEWAIEILGKLNIWRSKIDICVKFVIARQSQKSRFFLKISRLRIFLAKSSSYLEGILHRIVLCRSRECERVRR